MTVSSTVSKKFSGLNLKKRNYIESHEKYLQTSTREIKIIDIFVGYVITLSSQITNLIEIEKTNSISKPKH